MHYPSLLPICLLYKYRYQVSLRIVEHYRFEWYKNLIRFSSNLIYSTDFIGTNLILVRMATLAIASASIKSFLLVLTYDFTSWGDNNLVSCLWSCTLRPSHWEADRQFDYVCSLTLLWTGSSWSYAAVIIDLFKRHTVGYSISSRPYANSAIRRLDMSYEMRGRPKGVMFHSVKVANIPLANLGNGCRLSKKSRAWVVAVIFGT